jgi:cell division protein FtsQ
MDRPYRKTQQYKRTRNVSKEQKFKARRRLLRIFVFFLLVWGVLGFIRSDFFSVETIEFWGNTHTSEEELRQALRSGEGENIWQLSPAKLAERLKGIVRIEDAIVSRALPRTLVVQVTEKEALALAPYREYLLEVGVDGVILGVTQDPQSYALPLLTGIAPLELHVGDQLLSQASLEQAAAAFDAMNQAGVSVSEINISDEENLVLTTMTGLSVWLGRDRFPEKAGLLAQIMGQLGGRQDEGYLDLRTPAAPAFHIIKD